MHTYFESKNGTVEVSLWELIFGVVEGDMGVHSTSPTINAGIAHIILEQGSDYLSMIIENEI
jgi:hypothetical protein